MPSFECINDTLLRVVMRNGVVALFQTRVAYNHTFSPKTMTDSSSSFVGFFIADDFGTQKLSQEQIVEKYGSRSPSNNHFYQYTEKKHFWVNLKPIPAWTILLV